MNQFLLYFVALVCWAVTLLRPAGAQVPQLIQYEGRLVVGNTNFDGTGQFKFALVDNATTAGAATAAPIVVSGFVVGVLVADGGAGYTSPPQVTITDPVGMGATAVATISGGAVTGINVTNAGFGYSPFTTVTVAPPAIYLTYWSNDGTSTSGSAPASSVPLPVSKGLYSVILGDTSLANMSAIPPSVFSHPDVRLRVWFNDGMHGFQQLSPDQRVAAVGYAMMADGVKDGAITSAKIADGAVGSAQMASSITLGGTITAANFSGGGSGITGLNLNTNNLIGTINGSQIAPGAVGSTQLAKPPQSGTIDGSGLTGYGANGPFTVTFPASYTVSPVVTLAAESTSSASISVRLMAVTGSGFSGYVSNLEPPSLTVDAPGIAGQHTSLAVINGSPAIAYGTSSGLKFVRANDASGIIWGTPQNLDLGAGTGSYASLAVINGSPAISYFGGSASDRLKFVRANDASGVSWGTPQAILGLGTGTGVQHTSLAVVNGNPAISCYTATGTPAAGVPGLKFVRANDASGTAWDGPQSLDSVGTVGQFTSLAIVDGNPAISYYDSGNANLKFIRALDANGNTWGAPQTLDTVGTVGQFTSLAVVNGNPAISYYDATNFDLKFVRANDASGTAWDAPQSLDSVGTVGQFTSLAIVDGNPAISYYDSGNANLKFIRALDANGNTWGAPQTLDTVGTVGQFTSLAVVNGSPAVSYYDSTNGDLKFVRIPAIATDVKIHWIALPP